MTVVLFCLLATLPLALLGLGISRRYFDVLEPITAFYAGLVMVYVVPLSRHLHRAQDVYGDEVVREFLVAGLLLQVSYYAGYLTLRARRTRNVDSQYGSAAARHPEPTDITRDRVMSIFTWACLALGGLALALEVQNAGGFAGMLRSGGKIEDVDRAGTSTNALIMTFKPLLVLGLGAVFFQMKSWRGRSPVGPLTVILICAATAYPLAIGSRSRLISVFVLLVGSRYIGTGRRLPVAWLSAFWVVLFVAIANLVGARDLVRYSRADKRLPVQEWVQAMVRMPDMDSRAGVLAKFDKRESSELNCCLAVIDYIDREGPIGVDPLLELGTRWVPRAIWAKKMYPSAESFTPFYRQANLGAHEVRTSRGVILVGPAFGALGYLYGMGGMLGVGVIGLVIGAIGGALASLCGSRSRPVDGFLATLLVSTGLSDAIGTPLFWTFTVGPSLLVLILVARYTRKLRQSNIRQSVTN